MASNWLDQQLEVFKEFLQSADSVKGSTLHKEAVAFLEKFPRKLTSEEQTLFRGLLQKAFHLGEETIEVGPTGSIDILLPRSGWLHDYYMYTLGSEAPTAFHFGAALVTLGAAVGRNVFFDKGFYRIYPNMAAVLIAPTGKCRKTSATNIALGLAREVGVRVLSERITPEALVLGLGGQDDAVGLLYAPELAVFLGRQKYLEGMVPLLTSLFDAPEVWASTTISRGELKLHRVALSMLGASTVEWFVEALPREAFSGGFMSRLLFIVQEETLREFALPIRPEGYKYEELKEQLQAIREIKGEVGLEPSATKWFEEWYSTHHKRGFSDEKFAGYHERKPDHLLRIAMLTKLAGNLSLTLQTADLERSLKLLDWLEAFLPSIFKSVAETSVGVAQQRLLKQITYAPEGRVNHSALLRRNQHTMNARSFRDAIETLKESECIREVHSNLDHFYELFKKGE